MFVPVISNATPIYWEMEMSKITNTNPPQRGQELTTTDLNQVFTEANGAFPLDGDNVRNEGLDQPVFSLNSGHGKSGIILVNAASNESTTPVTVNANTATGTPFDAATTVQTWTVVQPITTADLIRVYWQFDYQNTVTSAGPVNIATNNGCVWALWLEYQLSFGGAWQPVENQNDFDNFLDTSVYGSPTSFTYGCTIYSHALVYNNGGSLVVDTYPHRTGYGCWWLAPSSNITIYGLRLQCRGLLNQRFVTPNNLKNSWHLQTVSSGTQQSTINKSYIAYMVMREQ